MLPDHRVELRGDVCKRQLMQKEEQITGSMCQPAEHEAHVTMIGDHRAGLGRPVAWSLLLAESRQVGWGGIGGGSMGSFSVHISCYIFSSSESDFSTRGNLFSNMTFVIAWRHFCLKGRETERFCVHWFTPCKYPQQPGLGQAKARSQ